jgi:hypothetical protein
MEGSAVDDITRTVEQETASEVDTKANPFTQFYSMLLHQGKTVKLGQNST